MIWSKRFFTTFIAMFFTIILMVNIIYAFNLVDTIGLPITNPGSDDTSNYYFGFTTLFNGFKVYFSENTQLQGFQIMLEGVYKAIESVNFGNLISYTPINNINSDFISGFLTVFVGIVNIFVNAPFILLCTTYFFIFLLYVIFIFFSFLSFVLVLLSGQFYTEHTNIYDLNNVILNVACLVKSPHCLGVWG